MSLKSRSKKLMKKVLVDTRALRLASHFAERSIVILKYHSIQDEPELFYDSIGRNIIHSSSVFRKQMEIIAKRYNPVSMDDVLLCLKGKMRIPAKAVAVTFDDGFTDNFDIAAPILDHYGVPATFYITVNSVESPYAPWFSRVRHAIWTTKKKEWVSSLGDKEIKISSREDRVVAVGLTSKLCANLVGDALETSVRTIERELDVESFSPKESLMMNWDRIINLHKNAHIIGSHTLNHPNVAQIEEEALIKELVESKRILEQKLDAKVVHFSYPNPALKPHLSDRTIQKVKEAGYETSVISYPAGSVKIGDNQQMLKRMNVPSNRIDFLWYLKNTLLGRSL